MSEPPTPPTSNPPVSESGASVPATSFPQGAVPQASDQATTTPQVESSRTASPPLGVIREIRWKEICPWLILVKALRVTLLIRVLVFAWVGVALTHWGWMEMDRFFAFDLVGTATQRIVLPPLEAQSTSQGFALEPSNLDRLNSSAVGKFTAAPHDWIESFLPLSSPFLRGWYGLSELFVRLVDRELSTRTALGLVLHGLWALVVWAIFGGVISRTAAIYLTRGEIVGPVRALRDAVALGPGVVRALFIPLLTACVMAVPLLLLGLALRLNWVATAAGLLWLVVFAWGLLLVVVLLGVLLGWPLMWACLAVERSDAFDGVSRCYAYVYQKPHKLLFYVVAAALLAYLGEGVVTTFVSATVKLSEWVVSWGAGTLRTSELFDADWHSSSVPLATRVINGWRQGLESLTASFPLACLWPFSVGIYLLLRSDVDATEMDEINL